MTVSRCGRHGEQRRNQFGVKTPSHAISNRTRQGWARRWDQPWFTTDGAFAAFAMGFACQLDKWLVWLTNTLQSTLIVYFNPKR